MRARWTALVRCFDDGRLALDNNPAERALRCVAMRRSLCPSCSSVWKHWKLVCWHDATRTTCSPNRGGHPFLLQVVGTDLVGSARHNLLGREDATFDKAADAVVRAFLDMLEAASLPLASLVRGARHVELFCPCAL